VRQSAVTERKSVRECMARACAVRALPDSLTAILVEGDGVADVDVCLGHTEIARRAAIEHEVAGHAPAQLCDEMRVAVG